MIIAILGNNHNMNKSNNNDNEDFDTISHDGTDDDNSKLNHI